MTLRAWIQDLEDETANAPLGDGSIVKVGNVIAGNVYAHIDKPYPRGTHVSIKVEQPGGEWCDDLPHREPKGTPLPVKAGLDYHYIRFYRTPGLAGDYVFRARIEDASDALLAESTCTIHVNE